MKAPTLNGNTLMLNLENIRRVLDFVGNAELTQFAVKPEDDGSFLLSFPLTDDFEEQFTGIVHGAKARAKDKDKPDPKPPTGGGSPDGTPPGGGTPGTPTLETYTSTEARAA
ncbi:hypothetical protein 16Q_088 [Pseudomonas phage 16Q]|nr:hypothetical protein 16Q_088 [Pseudomonas phage 16Q]